MYNDKLDLLVVQYHDSITLIPDFIKHELNQNELHQKVTHKIVSGKNNLKK